MYESYIPSRYSYHVVDCHFVISFICNRGGKGLRHANSIAIVIILSCLITQMTNEVGKAMFSRAGELGVPVGFMCMKVLQLSRIFNQLNRDEKLM